METRRDVLGRALVRPSVRSEARPRIAASAPIPSGNRQVVLDTETTGPDTEGSHRIIEIGCFELMGRRVTGRHLHRYLNPERAIDVEIHGPNRLQGIRLECQPTFGELASELVHFVADSRVIIHGAALEIAFLQREFALVRPAKPVLIPFLSNPFDTLRMARRLHPGQRNSLDALCARYRIGQSYPELRGALLDARILADVYLALTERNQLTSERAPHDNDDRSGPRHDDGLATRVAEALTSIHPTT